MDAVLRQALESDDKVLLQQCIGVTDNKVIQATVARLPPKLVSATHAHAYTHTRSHTLLSNWRDPSTRAHTHIHTHTHTHTHTHAHTHTHTHTHTNDG
jgi:hypothetical protein